MRLGLFGSAAPRVARRLAAEPQIEQRDLPPVMPPAWLVDKARAQGVDPMLEWQAMGGGSMPTTPAAPANNSMPSSVPPMGMFGGARKKAMSAASSLPPAAPQPSPQPVQPQVKGGMQMAAVDQASRPQQLGAFGNGPAQAAKPVGLWDEVWADPFTFFMTGTDGLDRKYGRVAEQAEATQAQQQKAELEAMIRTLPPEQQMLWRTNPEEMAKQLASNYAAANVGAGETRYLGGKGETFTAPKFGFEGATPYAQTFGDGRLTTTYGDNRPKSYAEVTDEATLAETGRSNRADEALGRDRLGFDRDKLKYEQTNPKGPEFGDENSLRSQYLGQVKTFQDVARAASSVRTLSPEMNPAEQMALIFQTMKMLDPTSSVREQEYANAQNTTGAYGQMWNFYNKAKDGKFLDQDQIANFRGMIDSLYKSAEGEYGKTYDFYRGMAPRYNMDPSIIQDFRLAPNKEAFGSGAIRASQSLIPQTAAPQAPDDDEDALVQKWLK